MKSKGNLFSPKLLTSSYGNDVKMNVSKEVSVAKKSISLSTILIADLTFLKLPRYFGMGTAGFPMLFSLGFYVRRNDGSG
jgi:hypothetical protein